MAGVDLVREPIASALEAGGERSDSGRIEYDFREEGLVVWLDPTNPVEVLYLLRPEPGTPPLVTLGHAEINPPALDTAALMFGNVAIPWTRWVDVWEGDRRGFEHPPQLVPGLPMLPPVPGQPPSEADPAAISPFSRKPVTGL